jgi:uncharacterized protein
LVRPSEWLPLVFGGNEGGWEDLDQTQAMLEAIMGLYNHINLGVLEGEPVLPPGCTVHAEPLDNFEPGAPLSEWARGFSGGYGWLENAWDDMAPEEFDAELDADLMILSFFSSRELAETYRDEIESQGLSRKRTLAELADVVIKEIPDAMQSIAHMGRALYEAVLARPQTPVRSEKIGRNDPCPCGSGRKYKKCCGTALH